MIRRKSLVIFERQIDARQTSVGRRLVEAAYALSTTN